MIHGSDNRQLLGVILYRTTQFVSTLVSENSGTLGQLLVEGLCQRHPRLLRSADDRAIIVEILIAVSQPRGQDSVDLISCAATLKCSYEWRAICLMSMKRPHIPYTQEEIDKLWANADSLEWVDLILIQCYSGWRPQELGLIEMKNVDIENWFFRGGMKTEAGTDRLVPIHSRIRPFVLRHYQKAQELGSEYLFNCTDTKTHRSSLKLTYDKWQQRYNKVRDRLGLNPEHRAHDGRKHFVTKAKKYEFDEYAIKYMVGHNITDITEKVYTVREREWLQSEIEKI